MAKTKIHKATTVSLKGSKRDAQNAAQADVITEFMRTDIDPMYRLLVNFATGVGKGKAAIETAIKFYDNVSTGKLFIGCFTEKQRDNVWSQQLAQWGQMHHIMVNNQRECYASMSKIKGQHYGLVILDEVQHLTEESYSFFENNTFDGVLLLSATMPNDPEKKRIIKRLTYGRRLIIQAEDAIDAGIINDYEVYIVRLYMDNTEKFRLLKNSNTLYTERTGYLKRCLEFTQAKRSGNSIRIKFAAIERKRYLGNLKTKTLAALHIQNRFRAKGERFITIASSIEQCDALGTYVSHSKSTDAHYKAFLHNKINELISVNQIKEGENFDNLGRCLVVQCDKDPNVFTQIRGRVSRLPVGQISRIFILCMMETQDEVTVQDALKDTDYTKIKYYNLDRELYWPTKDHLNI
jgi:superfamily II DNA or RNA helicase